MERQAKATFFKWVFPSFLFIAIAIGWLFFSFFSARRRGWMCEVGPRAEGFPRRLLLPTRAGIRSKQQIALALLVIIVQSLRFRVSSSRREMIRVVFGHLLTVNDRLTASPLPHPHTAARQRFLFLNREKHTKKFFLARLFCFKFSLARITKAAGRARRWRNFSASFFTVLLMCESLFYPRREIRASASSTKVVHKVFFPRNENIFLCFDKRESLGSQFSHLTPSRSVSACQKRRKNLNNASRGWRNIFVLFIIEVGEKLRKTRSREEKSPSSFTQKPQRARSKLHHIDCWRFINIHRW